jgi:putative NIF3 family GTP cyclohydrolase 1 type 2
MQAKEIGDFIEQLSPGVGGEEGFRFGEPGVEVSGVLVCWMATVDAIEAAAGQGCNMIVCHEELTYPYEFRAGELGRHLWWRPNARRLSLLGRHGMVVYRAHGMLDRYCILDDFAELLGLPEPEVKEGYLRICVIEPTTVRELAERVKERTGMTHVRVSGDLEKVVSRVGLPWGGLGLSLNASFLQQLLAYDPHVYIAGESDEYAMRFTTDCGIPMIETSHSTSENPGLEHFASDLRRKFPDLKVVFYSNPVAWVTV